MYAYVRGVLGAEVHMERRNEIPIIPVTRPGLGAWHLGWVRGRS